MGRVYGEGTGPTRWRGVACGEGGRRRQRRGRRSETGAGSEREGDGKECAEEKGSEMYERRGKCGAEPEGNRQGHEQRTDKTSHIDRYARRDAYTYESAREG